MATDTQIPIPGAEQFEKHLAVQQPTPMEIIHTAVRQGASIDTIERLFALQERMLTRNAEALFNVAMNKAQEAMGPVRADLDNPQTHSKYASYAALDHAVRPIYSREGFSLSFDTGETTKPEHVRVVCYASHVGGHTRTYHADIPADGKGAKGGDVMTKTHAAGAAVSYGMRYLLKMIFNIAVGECDTDGNAYNFSELTERLEWIANASNFAELDRLFKQAYQDAGAMKDQSAQKLLIQAKDKRRAELR